MRHSVFHFIGHLFARPRAILFLALRILHSFFLWIIIVFVLFFIIGDMIIPIVQLFVKDKREVPHKWSVFWSRVLLFFSFVRLKVEGLENIPPGHHLIIMPNHQSHYDYPILFSIIPFRFSYILKKELLSVPFAGKYMRISGFYALDRRAAASAYHTMQEVGEAIKGGDSILLFPEGTRTMDGSVGSFKGGGFKLALETGVPVLPVAISGAFGILRRFTWQVNPSRVFIKIGKPVHLKQVENPSREDLDAAVATVQQIVVEMHKELEEKRLAAKGKHHPASTTA